MAEDQEPRGAAAGLPASEAAPARDAAAPDTAGKRVVELLPDPVNQLIESEIIPRLLMAHSDQPNPRARSRSASIEPGEASAFAPLPLSMEASELLDQLRPFLDRGASVESLYVDLLTPSARRLGQLWEDDRCDFVEVTMAMWRLQEVMREIGQIAPPAPESRQPGYEALFAPMPGDQHSFGALMIEEIFSRAGWCTEILLEPRRRELLELIELRSFDLIGLTISNDCPSATTKSLVTAIRKVSRNQSIRVLIGGRIPNANPSYVKDVGADGTADDGHAALALATRLVKDAQLITVGSQ